MTAKQIAESYFSRIPDGHVHAMQRPPLDTAKGRSVDRDLREMIEWANHNGDCIINVGRGIYRPIPGNKIDELEFKEYIAKDRSRSNALAIKVACMEETMDARRREIIYAKQQEKGERWGTGTC